MRGQIKIDFVFGVVIFAVIIFLIVNQSNILFSSLLTDSNADILKSKASSVVGILVEGPGDPSNWEGLPYASVKRVGFAERPYALSSTKILRLQANCSTSDVYGNLIWNFGLKAYRLRAYNSTGLMMICGFDSLEPPTVTETSYVTIDGGYGRIVLDLW